MTHLRPCPFCGGKAGLQGRQFLPDPERYYVCCYTCDARGPIRDCESIARRDWNGTIRKDIRAAAEFARSALDRHLGDSDPPNGSDDPLFLACQKLSEALALTGKEGTNGR